MNIRVAPLAAIFSVLAFVAWIWFGQPRDLEVAGPPPDSGPAAPDQVPGLRDQTAGSIVPCAVPMSWRIARVDRAFGFTQAEAMAAFDAAARVWEEALGMSLFSNESGGDLAIRFVYDERQAHNEVRMRLEARRDTLAERDRDYDGQSVRIRGDLENLEDRIVSLNDSIRYWNSQGGAPDDVLRDLNTMGRAIDRDREDLAASGREIDGLQRQLLDDSDQLDRERDAHRIEGEALEATFPGTRLQSGTYREAVHTQDGRVSSVTREIRVFRFDGSYDLVHIAAHELGHALGLGHNEVAGGVMSEEFALAELAQRPPRVQAGEVELFRSLCPGL